MANKKVLILPGDGPGPSVISAAEKVIRAAAPGVDLIHGEIGNVAYEHTSKALPASTMDMISTSDAILSGPADMSLIGGRDPIADIKRQMHLFAEVQEFRPLAGYLADRDVDILLVSHCVDAVSSVRESEGLDGVVSELDTDDDALSELFTSCMHIAEVTGRMKICLVRGMGLFESSERHMLDSFHSHFATSEFSVEDMSAEKAACLLQMVPETFDVVVSGTTTSQYLRGLLSGMIGGSGISPVAYLGERKGLFMPSRTFGSMNESRPWNPTSAILAGSEMLRYMGFGVEYSAIQKAVSDMYESGLTTSDIGEGHLSPDEFTQGVIDRIREQQ
ncbi:isocitrate/isopropylmalate family dehydrogenase [Methanomethylophilus alvi]|uniref:isocitrate/isopropylmalate family dehydrogenase n=1 Tax=Methanomethylophilus alvi TaxID=1291540 RepID=UPI0037DD4CA2